MNATTRNAPDLSRPAALAIAAAVMLIPANLLPILDTQMAGDARVDTIWSGIVELYESGLWPLALIVFAASLIIPIFKLAGLAWLMRAARRGAPEHKRRSLTRLYATLDIIGRWSMLDVFLVAFLTGVVRFGAPAMVVPRSGIVAFAAAVVLTILATRAFNPRLLWDTTVPTEEQPPLSP
ncbi:MAG: paraquat-inducible protein A [Rariglobus sp.]